MSIPASPTTAAPDADLRSPVTVPLLLVLGLLSAVAPLATDLYLPAFPAMAADLGTGSTQVQLTLTAFLAGLTLGQLAFGPLSDRLGRRGPLLVGAVLFVLASAAAALAPSIGVLIAARMLQGLAGAAGMVIGRAMISDLAHGPAAARAFSLMMIVGGVAPVIAPVAGGALTGPLGWRGLLGIILVLAIVMVVSVLALTRETLSPARRAELAAERRSRRAAPGPLSSRTFVGRTVTFGFAFAVMMAYISASPFLYQELMGFGAGGYGIAFGVNALALMVVSAVSAQRAATVAPERMLRTGVAAAGVSVLAALVLAATGAPAIWLMLPIFTTVGAMGLIFGNATALALGAVPQAAGTASALLGALQFGLGALVSPLVSLGGGVSALPMVLVMTCCIAISAGGLLIAREG
ncbi:multidrug effflux MFS transporter [Brachybacterium phenoliresistens]|uniref:multidrug effflux MFS transporter n=1 Tax=Brachybacterium phenoliresistens TaxID=396014 RepID=UPI0031CF4C22